MFTPAWFPGEAVPLRSDAARERPEEQQALSLSADDDPAALRGFPALRAVRTSGVPLCDALIDALAALPALEELRLADADLSASKLGALARLKGLRSLSVALNADASDADLAALGSLADLERVDVRFTGAGASTFAVLVKLPRLREMWIGSTKIPGAALAKMPLLSALELLEARSLPWTPKALSVLGKQPALRVLDLSGVKKLAGAWWSDVAARGALERIALERTMVTSAELSKLIGKVPLREVEIEGCSGVDDATVGSLGSVPTLTHLSISFSTHLTDAALSSLCASTSLRSLHISSCEGFSQRGLASLASITSLRAIEAILTPLEDATLLAWMEALPLERCNVALSAGLSPAGYRAARSRRPSCELLADELLMAEEKPELPAARAFSAKLHEAAVNQDATAFIADYPGEVTSLDAQGAPRAKRKAVSVANHLDFARNGRWLVCDHNNGKIAVWDAQRGKALTLPSLVGIAPRAAVAPDGSRVAVEMSLDLRVLDLPSSALVFSAKLTEPSSRLLFSDDGQRLAASVAARVLVFDLAGGEVRAKELAGGCVPLSFESGSLVMATPNRAVLAVDLATAQEIERWEPYVTARRVTLVGSHKPAFVAPAPASPPAFKEPTITQWVRTRAGFVAVASVRMGPSELITPDLVVRLEQRDGFARQARLSGDGCWLVWPSELGGDSMLRVWSVEALLAFARAHAVEAP